ncbi:hypothetical protein SG34_017585 [Thalassomonas viridans]|uniref:Uncharacterized protein n=1 Tax=Thalassomonas viridans TaxID=137584 RepID=A0AAF0C708_9GAMM|nr:hypothetical protein [Thalassomonas viridans]WDE03208.1 hypothetical protein SG34_017585 [Thalassomonas viridans]
MNKNTSPQKSHQENTYSQPGNTTFQLGPEQQGIIYAGLVLLVMVAIVVLIIRKKK